MDYFQGCGHSNIAPPIFLNFMMEFVVAEIMESVTFVRIGEFDPRVCGLEKCCIGQCGVDIIYYHQG